MSLHVFMTDLGRSSHSGSAWVTATRTFGDWASVEDMIESDQVNRSEEAREGDQRACISSSVALGPLRTCLTLKLIAEWYSAILSQNVTSSGSLAYSQRRRGPKSMLPLHRIRSAFRRDTSTSKRRISMDDVYRGTCKDHESCA